MLDREFTANINYYLDVLLYRENNVISLHTLEKLNRNNFNNYFYLLDVLNSLRNCKARCIIEDIDQLYVDMIYGLEIELSVGKTLN